MARRPSPAVVMAAVAFGVFVAADDLTVVSTMLRQIIGDLEIPLPSGFDDAAWIVNSYLIAYVAVMPFMGRLSDLVGRRKVYVGALVVFLAGSLWIPFTTSLGWFIAARVLTAIGGGAMVPVALAVIGDLYEEDRRPRAYGILGAVDTIGWVWGPLFGAMLVRFLDWRWQFYLNVPLALIGIAVAWWALRDFDRPTARAAVDWPGAATLTVALVSLNIALLDTSEISVVTELSELAGVSSGSTTWLFGVAAVFFVAFWLIERRRANPIIDPALFRARNFTAGVGVNFLVGAVL
ncbi:MAG: MFS transporter, partial [Acidimicrobiia bacterium]|nr:MFS transporter [Acidimicrobiia bacterium]